MKSKESHNGRGRAFRPLGTASVEARQRLAHVSRHESPSLRFCENSDCDMLDMEESDPVLSSPFHFRQKKKR